MEGREREVFRNPFPGLATHAGFLIYQISLEIKADSAANFEGSAKRGLTTGGASVYPAVTHNKNDRPVYPGAGKLEPHGDCDDQS